MTGWRLRRGRSPARLRNNHQQRVTIGNQSPDAYSGFLRANILHRPCPVGGHLQAVVALAEHGQDIFAQRLGLSIGRIQAHGLVDEVFGFDEVGLAIEGSGLGQCRLSPQCGAGDRLSRGSGLNVRLSRFGGIGRWNDRPRHGKRQHHGGKRDAARTAHDDS